MGLDKKEIVSRFLKEGYQVEPKAVDLLIKNPEKIDLLFKNLKIEKESGQRELTTITIEYINTFFEGKEPKIKEGVGEGGVKVIEAFSLKDMKEKIDIENYTKIYTDYYETIRNFLLEKMPGLKIISINKIQKQKEFSLIVMAREKDPVEQSLLVEDLTGNVSLYIPKNTAEDTKKEFDSIIENDVFGVVCEGTPDGLKIKHVIWPDVPLNRKINKTEEDTGCLFLPSWALSSNSPESKETETRFLNCLAKTKSNELYVFILEGEEEGREDIEKIERKLSAKSKKKVKFFLSKKEQGIFVSIGDVKILILPKSVIENYGSMWPDCCESDVVVNLLKRRSFQLGERPIVLDHDRIPDIVVVGCFGSETASFTNYKGITIVSVGNFGGTAAPWLLELKTREINKVDFS